MTNPDPEKGQHFLKNAKILKKEISVARLKKTDNVIEIGAGDGRLSVLISEKVNSLTSYENDIRFSKELENLKLKNTKFIFENALKDSWKGKNKIVSNIPYSLSEPIIMKAIEEKIKELTLIVGENFSRILKEKTTKIGVITNLYFKIEYIEKVLKTEFEPAPRVDSYMIRLIRKKPSELELVLQAILEKDSKTKNAIIKTFQTYGKTKNQARDWMEKNGLNPRTLEKSTKTLSVQFIDKLREKLKGF